MKWLDHTLVLQALRATAEELARLNATERLVVVLCGGSAGLLGGLLRATRATADCDVLWFGDEQDWSHLAGAAAAAASRLGLPPTWLNRDATIYAWCLPIGWQSRCIEAGIFGLLDVRCLSRLDLIASKVVSAPARPHDLEDLQDLRPSADEIAFVSQHIDRLESEDLDRASYDAQRVVLRSLGGAA